MNDTETEAPEQSAEQSEFAQEMAALQEKLKAETEAQDIGDFAADEDEKILHRYLKRRTQLTAEMTHFKDQVTAMLKSFDTRIHGLDYIYLPQAEDIAKRKLAGKKTKSLKTPFGTVGFRSSPAKLEVVDESKVDEKFCKSVIEIDKMKLNDAFKADGEIPAGCKAIPSHQNFYVK